MDYYVIGQRIRKTRKAHGLSQEQLAELVGISTTHMSHIETGNTKLSLPVLVSLADVFCEKASGPAVEVSTDDLLFCGSPTERGSVLAELTQLLESCTTQQLKITVDVLRATIVSLKKHL